MVAGALAAVGAAKHVVAEQRFKCKRGLAVPRSYVKRARAMRAPAFCLDVFSATLIELGVSFDSYFRLPRHLFDALVERIAPFLRRNENQANRACGHLLTPVHRVAVALRWMAGAQWQDIVIGLRPVSKNEIFTSVWMVVDAINTKYAGEWSYPTPGPTANRAERRQAVEFYAKLETR